MGWYIDALRSSIGKKFIMGILALGLCGFIVGHLGGNFTLFFGEEVFNSYAHHLESIPGILFIELALAGLFGAHVLLGLILAVENWMARPQRYAVVANKGTDTTLASRTMLYSGVIVFAFLAIHILNLRIAKEFGEMPDAGLYALTINLFQNVWYVIWYVFGVCVLGVHVYHGLQSAVRTLGFNHPKYMPAITWLSLLFGIVMAIGFAIIPLWALIFLEPIA